MSIELESLRRFDQNADELYPKLTDAADVTIDRTSGEIFRHKRGEIFLGIGIPDLLFRLECQKTREAGQPQDAIARAKIWRHVAESCKLGDQIADISHDYQLNSWLPESHPKFTSDPTQLRKLWSTLGHLHESFHSGTFCSADTVHQHPARARNRLP